jgi:starvation-inducible DNA-binding protein
MNEELLSSLKQAMADSFVLYYKAHAYHWNVEGADFKQYHDLFAVIYLEIFEAIDTLAEHIRQLDDYAPASLSQLKSLSMISEDDEVVSAMSMVSRLLDANNLTLASLMMAYRAADNATELGLANFIQDRIAAHQKHGWMLKATLK